MARRINELTIEELSVINTSKVVKDIDFQTALTLFIDDCEIRNLRPQTIRFYKNELSVSYKILRENDINPQPDSITKEQIKRIILFMKENGLQTVTINTRLRAIRAFFNFLYRERHIKDNPLSEVKLLKDRRKVVETFTKEQLHEIFNQPNLRSFVGVRDYTFMLLLLETGIRVSELEDVCVQDILWNVSKLHIRNTKTYKERLVPIQSKMKTQFQKYIQIRGVLETDCLICNS